MATEHQELRLEEVGKKGELGRVFLTGREYFLLEYRKRTSSYYDRNLPADQVLTRGADRPASAGAGPPPVRLVPRGGSAGRSRPLRRPKPGDGLP